MTTRSILYKSYKALCSKYKTPMIKTWTSKGCSKEWLTKETLKIEEQHNPTQKLRNKLKDYNEQFERDRKERIKKHDELEKEIDEWQKNRDEWKKQHDEWKKNHDEWRKKSERKWDELEELIMNQREQVRNLLNEKLKEKQLKQVRYMKVLKLKPGFTKKELKISYKKLSLKHHPDKGGDVEMFKQLNEAYCAFK